MIRPDFRKRRLQRIDIHVSFEWRVQLQVMAFGTQDIAGLGVLVFDIRPGGVEVRIVGDDIPGIHRRREENALGGAPLVRGDDVAETGEIANNSFEALEGA